VGSVILVNYSISNSHGPVDVALLLPSHAMNEFTEVGAHSLKKIHIQVYPQDHSERLLSKEWLVKIDNERSIPYLMVRPPI
jgi:hypothetical protein